MDGEMLEALLFGVEGLKLIAAADVNTDHITLLMQFWKLDQFTYYDIDSFFNPARQRQCS